jgi:hypothetical protein
MQEQTLAFSPFSPHQFQRDPTCRVFLTTNAGSTGLNLQAANTVILRKLALLPYDTHARLN